MGKVEAEGQGGEFPELEACFQRAGLTSGN